MYKHCVPLNRSFTNKNSFNLIKYRDTKFGVIGCVYCLPLFATIMLDSCIRGFTKYATDVVIILLLLCQNDYTRIGLFSTAGI